jgi:fructose-bisphosphate aldolase class II
MPLISLRQLLDHAAEHDYGLPAFNVNNMEQMLAIMKAADKANSPVIMQASRGARKFANDIVLSHLIRAAIEMYPHLPICMHQDHGNSAQTCLSALVNGFSSVMMDGSLTEDGTTPSDFEYNANVTAKVSEMAHLVGASIEGEIGHLGSLENRQGRGRRRPRI